LDKPPKFTLPQREKYFYLNEKLGMRLKTPRDPTYGKPAHSVFIRQSIPVLSVNEATIF
jgi:hypothetical protein